MRTRELIVALALVFGCGHSAAPVAPAHDQAAAVGAQAPDGQLTQTTGTKIALAGVLHAHVQTVVVFYRGFW